MAHALGGGDGLTPDRSEDGRRSAYSPGSPTVMEVGERYGPMRVASPAKLGFWKRYFATQEAW